MKSTFHIASVVTIACGAMFTDLGAAIAQIIPDNTLPTNSMVTPGCLDCVINGGTVRGNILFHSFDRFSIGQNGAARFNNNPQLGAIVTRVIGPDGSNINGLVQANGNTNFFLINPQGITFGPNAGLALGGSFMTSTASSFLFPGGEFSALHPTAPPLLDVQVQAPIGLQFEGTPKAILINGSYLSLLPTKTLGLIGGDITLDGSVLTAPGGQILIGGLAGNGIVKLSNNSQGLQLYFPKDKLYSDISLSNDAQANVQSNGSGNILIHSHNLILEKSSLLAGLNSVPISISQPGNIQIDAQGEITMKNSHVGNDLNGTVQDQNLASPNQLGSIYITANAISFSKNSNISSSTRGKGNAGNLVIKANDRIDINNSYILTTVGLGSVGNGGNIQINTELLNVKNDSILSVGVAGSDEQGRSGLPPGNGTAGRLIINAIKLINVDNSQILGSLNTGATGQGGTIVINTDILSLSNQGRISTSTNGYGKAGSLTINAAKEVSLTGQGTHILSGLEKDAIAKNVEGGSVTINTALLTLSNKAMISAGTEGEGNAGNLTINATKGLNANNSFILSTVNDTATGKGGNIVVNTERILLSNQSVLSTGSEGKGDAGNLTLNSTKDIVVDDNSKVNSTLEGGQGKGGEIRVNTGLLTISNQSFLQVTTERSDSEAGKINVNANSIYLLNSGAIEAKTQSGNGGNIELIVRDLLLLRNQSRVSTTAGTENAGGNGGNVMISAPTGFIVAVPNENSDITANAFSDQGGKITINAKAIFGLVPRSRADMKILDPKELNSQNVRTSDITAISQQNPILNGEVVLNSTINPNQGLNQVPKEPRATDVADSCQVSNGQESVQFYDIGRGGLPPRPEDPLSMDLIEWSPLITKARIRPSKSLKIDEHIQTEINAPDRTTLTYQASNSPSRLIPPCQSH